MSTQNFNTQTARVNKLKGEILAHAIPKEVLGITGMQKQMPKNQGNNVIFRRWLPLGGVDNKWITSSNVATFAADHLTAEGVTPSADTLTAVDVTATLDQYSCLYAVTDKTVDLYEDDVPAEMKKQTGERMGLVREMVRYGALKAMTNVFYGGTGTSPSTVNGTLSLNLLRKVTRSLRINHSELVTQILAASPNFATAPVEAAYLVFGSTDMEPAIRDLPGFKHVAEYGNRKPIHELELGSVENYRFILSPELAQTAGGGAAVGSTGLQATASVIDIYPMIVVGENVWGQLALRGADSMDVTWIPPGQKDKNDPLGQRGYIGSKFYQTAKVLNDGWGSLLWVGTPSL